MHAVQLGLVAPKLAALEAEVMIVVPEPMARAQKIAKLIRTKFPVLADPDRHVFRSFGFGRKFFFIQQSGTVVVGPDGWIAYARRSTSPSGALVMAELMRTLERLGGTREEIPS